MSKTFTCCELVERIKNSDLWKKLWKDKDKYLAVEFLNKAATELIHRGKNESGAEKNVWDSLFCGECQKWFDQQEVEQVKLIDAEIEKEETEGTFYTNPDTQETLKKFKRQADEVSKELEKNEPNDNSPPFGKSPQE